ncbi:MAG TPA: hypothetical protein VF017_02660 [Thermoanaerobaculia bacterium]|nr:hypothetical protein [Thermoanaerobaculia bacterium]
MKVIPPQPMDFQLFAVPVSFNPAAVPPISFPAGSTVEVTSRMALIVFYLNPLPAGVIAGFSATPIDWLDSGGRPISRPACFQVVASSPDRVALLDINVASADAPFHLALNLTYNGQTYSSPDPTVLNKEDPIGL